MYICIHRYNYTYIYKYIYIREREREREQEVVASPAFDSRRWADGYLTGSPSGGLLRS